jgi:hypothetical protein
MSRKDKRLYLLLCILTSVLLSLILTEVRFKFGAYAQLKEVYETVQRINVIIDKYENDEAAGD